MFKEEILNECLKSILSYVNPNKYPEAKKMIKLILENFGLTMQIESMKELNKTKE